MIWQTICQDVKNLIAQSSEWSSRLHGTAAAPTALVLCYHSVGAGRQPLTLAAETLRQQIELLRRQRYEFLTFGELARRLVWTSAAREATPPRNTVAITFDDGLADNYTQALPILLEAQVPATFFITTGLLLGERSVVQRYSLISDYAGQFLTVAQVKQMRRLGMEIGAHSHTHANLAQLPLQQAAWELTHSKLVLEQILQEPVQCLAYPFGARNLHYTDATVQAARESGYTAAASLRTRTIRVSHPPDPYQIPRFWIGKADAPRIFMQKVRGHFDWLGVYEEHRPVWGGTRRVV